MFRLIPWILLGLPLAAHAGEKREAVLDLLNAVEDPIREADLRALGDGVDAELMDLANDGTIALTRRGKALSALQFYPTDSVRTFLEARLVSADASILRRKAAYSLAVYGSASVPSLTQALGDADLQLRIAAAQALGGIADPAAVAALQARAAIETEAAVKDAITKAVAAGGAH